MQSRALRPARNCRERRVTTMSHPFPRGLAGLWSEVGLLAPGPIPPRLPIPLVAVQWLRADPARHGELPRLQWRVRAGFTPTSLATDPVLSRRVYPIV